MMPLETGERLARLGAHAAAEVQSGMLLGLGSGSTAEAFVRALGDRIREGLVVSGVATSNRTATLAAEAGVRLLELDDVDQLDVGYDGADEIDPELNLVKGRGGALLNEKLVALCCDRFVVISASEKMVEQLGTRMTLPVEIVPVGRRHTQARLEALGCAPNLRMAGSEPFVTDGGHFILDCETGPIRDPLSFASALKEITGVVEHGLFLDIANRALIVGEDGSVREIDKQTQEERA
jgi:ribose 5-phosphate isomerase A